MSVRVRFAPSPTGFLHVGGARTAIFNWLYARRHGGVFVLRIEDTDAARSSEELVRAILDGLAWLGLDADEGPYFQSAARERHVADADRLVASGHAYRDFTPADEAQRIREWLQESGGAYRGPERELEAETSRRRAAAGEPHAVRFRVPPGRVEWEDRVHRRTGFDTATIEDFVLLRSDRSPTYMLSVVSDDIEMRITDVIRGDDHISNTPKQILLYEALGRPVPRFAHLPLILGEDKKRLSKRHGAVSVLEYREQGYLPEAMLNFLALLGWAPGDGQEKMDRQALVERFDLEGVGRSGAIFDLKKLDWLNGEYLAELPPEKLAALVRPALEAAGLWRPAFEGPERERLHEVLKLLGGRARRVEEFASYGRPYLDPSDELTYDPAFAGKHLKTEGLADHLRSLARRLAEVESWDAASLESVLRDVAGERGVAAGKLIHPVRLAVTGMGVGPGIFEVLVAAGRERSCARIERLVRSLEQPRAMPR
jgi:glutamyl-tRNA synthetase